MTDTSLLADALFRSPGNSIVFAMLKDELMDTADMLDSEAARHAAAIVIAGARAAQFHRAAKLLSRSSPLRDVLMWDICAEVGFIDLDDVTFFVVPGDRPALLLDVPRHDCSTTWPSKTVLIGAVRLLSIADRYSR